MHTIIETERLRPFVEADAVAYVPLVTDPDVVCYAGGPEPDTLQGVREILRSAPLADYARYSYGRFARQSYAYIEDMGMAHIVEQLEKLNDYTVRFKLRQPEAPFLAKVDLAK